MLLAKIFFNFSVPSNDLLCAFHPVEVASTPVSVSTHSRNTKPIRHFHFDWSVDVLGNNIHTITSHSEKS